MPSYIIKRRDGMFRLYSNGIEVLARPKLDQVSLARDRLLDVFSPEADAAMDAAIDGLLDDLLGPE